jgi:hypothetical protein
MDSSVIPSFDIFTGRFGDKDVVWVEAVEGLAAARQRMEHFASQAPGPYFVFSSFSHMVLAAIDTTHLKRAPAPERSKTAGAA